MRIQNPTTITGYNDLHINYVVFSYDNYLAHFLQTFVSFVLILKCVFILI